MRVARLLRVAALLVAAGAAVAEAARRRAVRDRPSLPPGRSEQRPGPAGVPVTHGPPPSTAEDAPAGDVALLFDAAVEQETGVELSAASTGEPTAADPAPGGAPPPGPASPLGPPPVSVTDVVDDLVAPDRDRDVPIEDATVVEDPLRGDGETRAGG